MELCIESRVFFPGYKMPIWYTKDEDFTVCRGLSSRFRLIFLENGAGVLRIGGHQAAPIAPGLICLNEKEELRPEDVSHLKARALYFHPELVNGRFSFENIRTPAENLSATEQQDLWCFKPFIHRDGGYIGLLSIGPATAQRIAGLMDAIDRISSGQPDENWPCRTRACFFELLFLVERIFSSRGKLEEIVLPEISPEIEKIILYLHLNYQNPITIRELTDTFHINRTTLAQRFLKETGYTVIAYLTHLRINLASMILRDTKLPVSEIIERVGFGNLTHFGRIFKKYTGLTPSEYREKYCWMLR